MDGQFFNTSGETSSYTSRKVAIKSSPYSIGVEITGSFNVDVKVQTSLSGENWGDIKDASGNKAEVLGLSDPTEIVHFDINVGRHRFSRLVITHNSGSFDAKGYVK